MSYNQKKFLDANGLTHFIKILDNYPTNEILDTVINAIQSSIDNVIIVSDTQPTASDNKIWIKPSVQDTVQVPTVEEMNEAIAAVDVPVQDVQINGTSILSNGIANVPVANQDILGLVKVNNGGSNSGIKIDNGTIKIIAATADQVKSGVGSWVQLTPINQHRAAFYGLTKAAGVDMASSDNPVGTYTPEAKGAIQKMLGVSDLIGPEENNLVASQPYKIGDIFTANGKLYKTTVAIAADAAIIVEGANANAVETKLVDEEIKDVRINNNSILQDGIVNIKIGAGLAVGGTGAIQTGNAGDATVKAGKDANAVIAPARQHMAAFYGLSKVAGVDLANETVTLGTYPDNAKAAIRTMIGAAASGDGSAAPVQDVQVNGTSILSNGTANIKIGVGLAIDPNGSIKTENAGDGSIKAGSAASVLLTPLRQHLSTFYGLSKVAGVDLANEDVTVGTYPETSKAAIRSMLGATSSNVIAVQDTQPTDTDTKIWLPETAETPVQIPTMDDMNTALAGKVGDVQINGTSIVNNGIANVPLATLTGAPGVISYVSSKGLNLTGGHLEIRPAYQEEIKTGTHEYFPLTPIYQHTSVFYGLAKASGDTTQAASNNAVGTYTEEAKSSIRTMLGAGKVDDVQINGTSILNNGTANIPIASSSTPGIAKVKTIGSLGITLTPVNELCILTASNEEIKAASSIYKPIVVSNQHQSVFYGLAKAAGDTTQSASSNAIGTYTNEAKAAIKNMLEITGNIQTITIEGTDPVIGAQSNCRYICGEVNTISITPSLTGICNFVFTSGSSPAVLTLPSTVKMPEWFDITLLDTNRIYEISISDGIYGAVTSWVL